MDEIQSLVEAIELMSKIRQKIDSYVVRSILFRAQMKLEQDVRKLLTGS